MSHYWPVLFALCWATGLLLTDFGLVFEFDPDEGNNLIKALLLERDYEFLSEIWSDQPPLYTYLLWGIFKLFGFDVAAARVTTVLFSALLLFAVSDTARREAGLFAGVASAVFLCVGKGFVKLSVSVMIGLPAIALAMLSVWALCVYRTKRDFRWLLLCGASMGASLAVKLFTVVVMPVLLLGLVFVLLESLPKFRLKAALPNFGWFALGIAGAMLLGFLPALSSANFETLVETHVEARGVYVSYSDIAEFFADDREIFLLALLGVLIAAKGRNVGTLTCGGWVIVAAAMLYNHDPVWQHHAQLLSAPAAVAAGFALAKTMDFLPEATGKLKTGIRVFAQALSLLSILLLIRAADKDRFEWKLSPEAFDETTREWRAQKKINELVRKTQASVIVSARQIYAFRANVAVAPSLAVTSRKRYRTKQLSSRSILREVERYKPQLVILSSRWPGSMRRKIKRRLDDYELAYADRKNDALEVYRRK